MPLSITAMPMPLPVYPDCHAANAFTAGAALLRLGVRDRSRLMYFTFAWFERERRLETGRSATTTFSKGIEFTIDPSKPVSDLRSNKLGAWLYCTTTRT